MAIRTAGVGLRTCDASVGPGVCESRVRCETSVRRADPANVEKATAVVMRYGCQRGESFEGCECAAEDGT